MDEVNYGNCECGRQGGNTLDGFLRGLMRTIDHALDADRLADRNGLLQGLDPRFKVLSGVLLIVSVTMVDQIADLAGLFVLAVVLGLASGISPWRLARQLWFGVLLFTGAIALPSLFIVPGEALVHLPVLGWPVTLQGLRSAGFLIGRAETSATFALLLVLTTRWPHVLKALRVLGVPVAVVAILGMTHRYIFLLLTTATQMFEARRSRVLAPMTGADRRRMIVSGAGVLLSKTLALASDVHLAMVSRGFRGEVRLIDDFRSRPRDWFALALSLAIPVLALWWS